MSSMKPRAKYGGWLRAPSRPSGAGSRSSCGFTMIGQADGFILKRWVSGKWKRFEPTWPSTAAAVELLVLCVLEPLVDDGGIGWQRNAVQINDLAVHDQLQEGSVAPFCSRIHLTWDRGFWIGELVESSRRRVDENRRGFDLE